MLKKLLIFIIITLFFIPAINAKEIIVPFPAPANFKAPNSCENSVSFCPTENQIECTCPNYCYEMGGKTIEKGGSCGGITDRSKTCQGSGGTCKRQCETKTDADHKTADEKMLYDVSQSDCPAEEMCCIKNNDNKKSVLTDCFTRCEDPDGCTCTHSQCLGEVEAGFNCANDNSGEESCVGPLKDLTDPEGVKDLPQVCPPGCMAWNDFRCGSRKNIGNALWDFAMKNDWVNEYYGRWMNFWNGLGAKLDPEHWTTSICNGDNIVTDVLGIPRDIDGFSGAGDLQGWMAVSRQAYNKTDTDVVDVYLYTFTWKIGGFSEDNNYVVKVDDDKQVFPKNLTKKWINISSGDVHRGSDASKIILSRTKYTKACVYFQKPVCEICSDGRNVCTKSRLSECEDMPGFASDDENYECEFCLSGFRSGKSHFCVDIKEGFDYLSARGAIVTAIKEEKAAAAAAQEQAGQSSLEDA